MTEITLPPNPIPDVIEVDSETSVNRIGLLRARNIYDVINANRGFLAASNEDLASVTLEDWWQSMVEVEKQMRQWLYAGFEIVHNGESSGAIGLQRVKRQHARMGYWLPEEAQGKGLMTPSVAAVKKWAFEKWDINVIDYHIRLRNRRSQRVAKRVGAHIAGFSVHSGSGARHLYGVWRARAGE